MSDSLKFFEENYCKKCREKYVSPCETHEDRIECMLIILIENMVFNNQEVQRSLGDLNRELAYMSSKINTRY